MDRILGNLSETKRLLADHANDRILFLRTIKHKMSKKEARHLGELRKVAKRLFPDSRVVVVSDVEENTELDKDIIYFKFDHWHENEKDKSEFLKLLKNRRILP